MTAQVTFSVIAVAVVSVMLILALAIYAVFSVDAIALERQKSFVRSGLAEQLTDLIREQQSVTVWDDSVINARAGNQDWMRDNLGEWMSSYYGHDRTYILDGKDRAIHVMKDGQTLPPAAFDDESAVLLPLVATLRERMARAQSEGDESQESKIVQDLVLLSGKPALVAVQPLIPDSQRLDIQPGTEYVDISVQLVDAALIKRIADHYLLEGMGLAATDPGIPASMPLTGSSGKTLGYLTWKPDRPGLALLVRAGPAIVAGGVLSLLLLAFLLRRLRRASQALQTSQNDAQYLAFHDTLTGLPNRALFEDRLDRALAAVRRGRGHMALLCIDLDRFKHVNDTLGHQAGDLLVKQASARLGDAIREIDTVARVGGDEFAVILVDIRDLRTAEETASRMLSDLREPFELMGDQVFISASIGIAIAPEFGTEPEELLRKADIALYEAKRGGRSCYQVFAGDMDDILKHKLLIERELRQALDADGPMDLAYQPVFAMDGQTLVGAVATLNWNRGGQGSLPGAQLVSIAAERGMIGELSRKMLRTVCAFLADTGAPWVAVALSPAFLRRERSAALVLDILADHGLAPSRLEIEIAESVLVDGDGATISALRTLREAGIRVCLDDFGTGASSLTTLRRHPVDKLKIDRSFVALLGGTDPAAAIVKSVTEMAAALGMRVAAEGVETAEQRTALAAFGCLEVQGPLMSPPLSSAQFERFARGKAARNAAGGGR
ncbi:putative bifunctional diguanylate cyclase/phosphodiesterase [Mesorhizobium yinganensis]|uniref:putative bifunctional diguanylate cyclase/phosphodiesterase n=1 Tax=Mesorhizobium yinganensis TaxID=3157707 RepID=UPI0032B710AF